MFASVWRRAGASVALVWARWAVLHSCLSWATRQRLLRSNPIATMKAPPRPAPRKHLRMDEIAILLRAANAEVVAARRRVSPDPDRRRGWQQLFAAEQNLLLIRLAADTGARRGELATLRLSDLEGRVLTIERNLSLEILGPTKSKRTRRMTIGVTTAAMVSQHFDSWAERIGPEVVGDGIFAPDYRRAINARASLLSHRFARFRDRAKVPDARLHRFRHSVATALVEDGKILKAQARLGHRDAATTLRHYAHATPLDDVDVADELDRRLNAAAAG